MSEAKAKRASKRVEFTTEQARVEILAKLDKAGVKGTASPGSSAAPKKEAFREALEQLVAEREVFADTSGKKPKYFRWEHRPKVPTVETVGEALVAYAASQFPLLQKQADFARQIRDRREKPLLGAALHHLVESGALVALLLRTGRTVARLFAPADPLRTLLGSPEAAFHPERVRVAYRHLAGQTGYNAVPIAHVQRDSDAPLPALHAWLAAGFRSGEVLLWRGDWALMDQYHAGAVELDGERYLLMELR